MRRLKLLPLLLLAVSSTSGHVFAATLSAAEIRAEMLNKTIVTRRFGMKVTMRYSADGSVSAKTLFGSMNGTWRPSGNKICSTFPSGPAKGTSCVSFTRLDSKRYKSSEGVRFQVLE